MVAFLAAVKKLAMMEGKVSSDWAKMMGIMPAMLTIKGKVPLTGIDMRAPMRRPGYMTGTLRRPCCTTTMANIVTALSTIMKIRPIQRVVTSASTPWIVAGIRATIPAKMIKERPWLRRPYSDISSPSQIANIVPAVILTMMVSDGRKLLNPKLEITGGRPIRWAELLNILTWPMACKAAMGTAR